MGTCGTIANVPTDKAAYGGLRCADFRGHESCPLLIIMAVSSKLTSIFGILVKKRKTPQAQSVRKDIVACDFFSGQQSISRGFRWQLSQRTVHRTITSPPKLHSG